jgi:hypothetical protein
MILDSRKVSAICLVDNGVVLGYDMRQATKNNIMEAT